MALGCGSFILFYWCPSIMMLAEVVFIIDVVCADSYFLQEDWFAWDVNGVRLVEGTVYPFMVCN